VSKKSKKPLKSLLKPIFHLLKPSSSSLLANASDSIAMRFSALSGLSYHRGIHSTLKKKKKRIALTSWEE